MNANLPTYTYRLIDNNKPINVIYSSDKLHFVTHEYMNIIREALSILSEFNITAIPKCIQKENLHIICEHHIPDKRHPIILEMIWYNFSTCTIIRDNLDNETNNKIKTLLNNKISPQKTTTSRPKQNNTNTRRPTVKSTVKPANKTNSDKGLLNSTVTEIDDIIDMKELQTCLDEIKNMKKDIHETKQEIFDKNDDINDKKRLLNKEKDREYQRKRKFDVNIDVYKNVKIDLENGVLDKVPVLFEKEYPIFEILEEQGVLDDDNVYEIYTSVYDDVYEEEGEEDVKEPYVPHNIHYLPPEEQEKYQTPPKSGNIPPLKDVLADISDCESSDTDQDDLDGLEGFDVLE